MCFSFVPALFEPIAVVVHLQDVDMMGESIEQGADQTFGAGTPVHSTKGRLLVTKLEARFVALSEHLEEQFGAVLREIFIGSTFGDFYSGRRAAQGDRISGDPASAHLAIRSANELILISEFSKLAAAQTFHTMTSARAPINFRRVPARDL